MTTNENERQDQEPTEIARTLHGDKARAETHDQPEVVELPAETLVARPGRDTSDAEGAAAGE